MPAPGMLAHISWPTSSPAASSLSGAGGVRIGRSIHEDVAVQPVAPHIVLQVEPRLHQIILILPHELENSPFLSLSELAWSAERHVIEPHLGLQPAASHQHTRWFPQLTWIDQDIIAIDFQHQRIHASLSERVPHNAGRAFGALTWRNGSRENCADLRLPTTSQFAMEL